MNKVGQVGRFFVGVGILSLLTIAAQAKTVFRDTMTADSGSNLVASLMATPDGSMTVFSENVSMSRGPMAENKRGTEFAPSTSAEVAGIGDRAAFAARPQAMVIGVAALTPSPEPGTMLLMVGGLGVIAWKARKRVRA